MAPARKKAAKSAPKPSPRSRSKANPTTRPAAIPVATPGDAPYHPTYAVHSGVAMVQDWINTLRDKTGRSLAQWMTFITKSGPETEAERRLWLKDTLKLGTNTAWWLAERSVGKGHEEDTAEGYLALAPRYVDAMFSGKREHLRPAHDAIVRFALTLGDIRISPGKTAVPFSRHHVFAISKPASNTRIDLGFCLTPLLKAKHKLPAFLIDTGGFAKKDRITHRVPISAPADLTDEVRAWFTRAYELDT